METFGRYQLQEKLGQGGMGVVYRAFDTMLERTVALKFVLSAEGIDPELRARLFREARAAGNLKHKCIVTIYDLGEHEGRPYLAMEYFEGEDLQRRLARPEKMSLAHKLDLAIEVSDGLAHAHAHGVIHRDIKPANIFITESGNAKLLDFGLARLMTSQLTRSNMLMGTINYMAPEQVRGERVDQRSDIFSFGVVLYELLGARKAFEGESAASTLYKILQEVPDPLSNLDPALPRELIQVVERSLAKLPDERYQSMDNLRQDLEKCREAYRGVGGAPPVATTLTSAGETSQPRAMADVASDAPTILGSFPGGIPAAAETPHRSWRTPILATVIVLAVAIPGAWVLLTRSGHAHAVPPQTAATPSTAVAAPTAVAPPPADPLTIRLGEARQALTKGSYTAAQSAADAALRIDPKNAEAARLRAAAHDGAVADARRVLGSESTPQPEKKSNALSPDDRAAAASAARTNARKPSPGATAAPKSEHRPALPNSPADGAPSLRPAPIATPPGTSVSPLSPIPPPPAPSNTGASASAPPSRPAPTAAKPPVPEPSASTTPSAETVHPEQQIKALVDGYKHALEAKDIDQLKRLWPSMSASEESAIRREFSQSSSIGVDIENPQISVSGPDGQLKFVRNYRVTKDGQHLQYASHAVMNVRKTAGNWVIASIQFSDR